MNKTLMATPVHHLQLTVHATLYLGSRQELGLSLLVQVGNDETAGANIAVFRLNSEYSCVETAQRQALIGPRPARLQLLSM